MIRNFLRRIGFLRALLIAATILLVLLSPFAGGHVQTSGWAMITTLLAPVFFVILAFVLCLDMLMTRLFMSGSADAERQRFTTIIRSEALSLVVLLASWAPFVISMLRLRGS